MSGVRVNSTIDIAKTDHRREIGPNRRAGRFERAFSRFEIRRVRLYRRSSVTRQCFSYLLIIVYFIQRTA